MNGFNFNNFKELFKLNILYANPQLTSQSKAKMEKKHQDLSKLPQRILFQGIGLSSLLMLLIYGGFAYFYDFSEIPLIFDQYLLFFFIMGTLQVFTLFYNVMYSSKDLPHLMPLPISSTEIYAAKLGTISLSALQMIFPMVIFIFKFFYDFDYSMIWSLIIAIYGFFVITFLFLLLNILLMEFMARLNVLRIFKESFIAVLNIILSLVAFGFIFITQQKITSNLYKTSFGPISRLIADPKSLKIVFLLSLLVLITGGFLVYLLGKNYLDHFMKLQAKFPEKKGKKKGKNQGTKGKILSSKGKVWSQYHKSLIMDQTILMTSIFSPILFLLMPAFSMIGAFQNYGLEEIRTLYQEIAFTLPIFVFVYTLYIAIFPSNLFSIICSVENENYDYLKTLPLDWKNYLNFKAKFCASIYTVLFMVLIGIVAIILKTPVIYIILAIAIAYTTLYSFGLFAVRRDFRKIIIGWQNISEVFNRSPKWLMFIAIFLFMIFIGLLTGGLFLIYNLSQEVNGQWILFIFLVLWILIDGGVYWYQQKKLNHISGGIYEN